MHLVGVANKFGLVGQKSKKPLTKQAIVYILTNPFYCGYARHKAMSMPEDELQTYVEALRDRFKQSDDIQAKEKLAHTK